LHNRIIRVRDNYIDGAVMKSNNVVLSVALAAAALSVAVLATGNETSNTPGAASPKAEPTPYSADHSLIEYRPGALTEQPATF
jgi:hypothetical protein